MTERCTVRSMCGVQLDRDGEAIDQFGIANSVCWYDHVLPREDGRSEDCVLRRSLEFVVRGQRQKGRLNRM